jgi:amino acid transporter
MRFAPRHSRIKLQVIQLAALIFFTVSGGPYGLEPLLSYAGKHGAILILFIIAVFWALPITLSILELNGMMPLIGGYYQWIKRSLGMRWAFYVGWWSQLNAFIDLAIYPKLLVEYAAFVIPSITQYKIPIYLLVIWLNAVLNIRGIALVGRITVILGVLLITPFLILFGIAVFHNGATMGFPYLSFRGEGLSSLGMATYFVIWNFIGWDDITTYANEVERPSRTYLLAICISFCCIFGINLLAIWVAIDSGIDLSFFSNQGFPVLGLQIGSRWLGVLIAAAGIFSSLGLFASVLLSISRVPKAIADDGIFPSKFTVLHPKYNTPYISIIVCALFVSCLSLWTLTDLIIVDVILSGAKITLELVALIKLRRSHPREHRPFKIPLGIGGLTILAFSPLLILSVAIVSLASSIPRMKGALLWAILLLLSADIAWRIRRYSPGRGGI